MEWHEDYGFELDDWLFDWDYMPFHEDYNDCVLEEAA